MKINHGKIGEHRMKKVLIMPVVAAAPALGPVASSVAAMISAFLAIAALRAVLVPWLLWRALILLGRAVVACFGWRRRRCAVGGGILYRRRV